MGPDLNIEMFSYIVEFYNHLVLQGFDTDQLLMRVL